MSAAALALCLALQGREPLRVPADSFTLSWTHSVERVEWREAWRVTPDGLTVVEARVRGSGAGMEPPDGARLVEGWWVYVPALPPQRTVLLAASSFTAEHTLCARGTCRPLSLWLHRPPGDVRPVELSVCS